MIRINEIQDKLLHVVGWGQPYNPKRTQSGGFIDNGKRRHFRAHPLLTLDNIKSIVPEQFIFIYPDW